MGEELVVGGGRGEDSPAIDAFALTRTGGSDPSVNEAHQRRAVILGFSAGAPAVFEGSVSDSFGGGLDDGLAQ
ncbi:MAG: hypothetical protein ACI9KE_003126 [Polyangiales bacterium]|jgi:hypothetical protein